MIHCPNCGSVATRITRVNRYQVAETDLARVATQTKCEVKIMTRTECEVCDYFMVLEPLYGRVLEHYAPGIFEVFIAAS